MIALLLTSVLLLAIDVQDSSLFDRGRRGFQYVLDPLESGAEVVTRPVRNAWRGITEYDELADENEELRQQIETQRADQIVARAYVRDYWDLLRLNNLPSLADYRSVAAEVLGPSPTNIDQIIEINKGERDGLETGMAVVSYGGLIGKVTKAYADRSLVMLISDPEFAVNAKVLGGDVPDDLTTNTSSTTPNAVPNDAITSTTAPPQTTAPPPVVTSAPPTSGVPGSTPPTSFPATGTTPGTGSSPSSSTTPTTPAPTTTAEPQIEKETGIAEGQGERQPIEIRLVDERVDLGRFQVGDSVMTAGGDGSLSPPGIPIGTIAKVVRRAGSAGPILEIEPSADISRLNFVEIVLYRPLAEVPTDGSADD